jgi:type VI protein secretion system component Hcp
MLAGACALGFGAASLAGTPTHLAAAHQATAHHATVHRATAHRSTAHPAAPAAAAAGQDAALTALTRPLTATPGDPIFMLIKGIPGESKDLGHKAWIDLSGFTDSFLHECGDCPSTLNSFNVTMPYSLAVPPLLKQLLTGTALATVEIQATSTTPTGRELNFLTITLTNVSLTALAETSTGGRPGENLGVQAQQVAVSYTTGSGTPEKFCYNFSTQKTC